MQYISKCVEYDCDFYWQGPSEKQAFRKLKEHTEEHEDHLCKHTGVYDTPRKAGWYDGKGQVPHAEARGRCDAIRANEWQAIR